MQINGLDSRYSIDLEFCGYGHPVYVVRWCGEWLGASDDHITGELIAFNHKNEREAILCGL